MMSRLSPLRQFSQQNCGQYGSRAGAAFDGDGDRPATQAKSALLLKFLQELPPAIIRQGVFSIMGSWAHGLNDHFQDCQR